MRAFGWSAALLALTGCTEVGGSWVGSCAFSDARYGYTAAISVDIDDGSGSVVQGEMVLDMFDGRRFEGNVSGLRSSTYIELEAPIRQEEGQFEITLTGDIDENVIEGECRVAIPGGTGALVGDLVLER